MNLTLNIWRQENKQSSGRMVKYEMPDVSHHMSFLEMLDVLNERLIQKGEEPVAFDHDCREGICGMCSLVINGKPHGKDRGTVCQLHMRHFKDGDVVYIEPMEWFCWGGNMDMIVPCGPAFDPSKHKLEEEK